MRRLRRFREETRRQYRLEEEKQMEPWKKDVMRLHEQAGNLFYLDDAEQEKNSLLRYRVLGEVVKGDIRIGDKLYLYDGQGNLLGRVEVMTDPEEREEKRLGLVKEKRNNFVVKILELHGEKTETMEVNAYQRQVSNLWNVVSLMADYRL
ncbi:MAG: hypothetical protein LUF92_14670 [Clostridiales bacterium]|nr:hypothetical protein [Clostridiales bacterium]